ncbi:MULTISPECIES: tRNA (adenosine(37)-N6)-threonylcarbamoyltransferase complex ATPase subunit type 1 TsaE [Rhodomicrobium]|uniref:tRNA (adenosine(37)-N6)-threonylcarbamoyltransferase complex ATPase subunit type 1 TsaE n=1 Tax=Rhodomicrobium TaxID=1068 RepID=UPI000B4B4CCD|nr:MULTISPECIES: tRNA (adenosine(37)-N6)-threonylcarbamoyltransferase complex ATPase subunit type 1 TsaE [Rhodomicrobium]
MSATGRIEHRDCSEDALRDLAEVLAPRLRMGDFLALRGELGAGKTAFARHLIRALLERPDEDVPSPTFALVQPYDSARFPIHHFDFYRLSGPAEALELGLGEALETGLVIAEWPERLGDDLPANRLEVALADAAAPDRRHVTLQAVGNWAPRLARFAAIDRFIAATDWSGSRHFYVNGDASARGYTRLYREGETALLMDWPKGPLGPPVRHGKPYTEIAHLTTDVKPFVAIAEALREVGLAVPEIYAQDLDAGLLLLEDFGDLTFTGLAASSAEMRPLYRLAVDALLALRPHSPPPVLTAGGISHSLSDFDHEALAIETELVPDWFLPALRGAETPAALRAEFAALWSEQFDWLRAQPDGWLLRDFHSPNLLWRPNETGLARLGIIDFQDAMRGHAAYDLVSLLQDARLDLPDDLEAELLQHYCLAAAKADRQFDRAEFLRAYRLLGAQRATKLLGLFTRLARRDGKRFYLRHLPRAARRLAANLADRHLAKLRLWYEREVPGGDSLGDGDRLAARL